MLNKVMVIGRLGQDPELRYMPNGSPVCNLSVATDESYTDREGNKVDKTEWHRVVVYQRQAETCSTYLGKGSLVYVEGSLQTRKWQDQQGQDRYTTEIKAMRIQFLDRRGEGGAGQRNQGGYQGGGQGGYQGGGQGGYQDGGYQGGGQGGYQGGAGQAPYDTAPGSQGQQGNTDMGSPFPSEASAMDKVPF